jgi:hypothetical protein
MHAHRMALMLPAALLLSLAGPARAETLNCTPIVSLPAVISTQGVYCLRQDLATAITAGNAIEVAANNVVIDCNGYKLGGLSGGADSQAVGIAANGRCNVTVRSCNIRGFGDGIHLAAPGGGHLVADNRVEGSTQTGIYVHGAGSDIRRNRVLTTLERPTSTRGAVGIHTYGDTDIRRNLVVQVVARAGGGHTTIGILAEDNLSGSIDRNRVRGVIGDGAAWRQGIATIPRSAKGRAVVAGNQVVNPGTAGQAISCYNDGEDVALDNVVNGFAAGVLGCVDGGGNVAVP